MRNILMYPVDAINGVRTNVWSVILIIIGTVLTIHGHSEAGAPMITGGFALLRTEASSYEKSAIPPELNKTLFL